MDILEGPESDSEAKCEHVSHGSGGGDKQRVPVPNGSGTARKVSGFARRTVYGSGNPGDTLSGARMRWAGRSRQLQAGLKRLHMTYQQEATAALNRHMAVSLRLDSLKVKPLVTE